MSKSSPLWVRIKPLNEKRGNRVRRYMAFVFRFDVTKGWHKVSGQVPGVVSGEHTLVDMREYLSKCRNDNDDMDSALVFDIVESLEETKKIDAAERRAREGFSHDDSPVDLTTGDVTTADLQKRKPGRPRKVVPVEPSNEEHARAAARDRR